MSVTDSISRFLPPPTFMTLPSVGVDISDTSMKYIKFERDTRHGGDLAIRHWGDIDIPERTLARGDVKDENALAQALSEVKRRTNCAYVRVSLPEERAYLFETEVKRGTPFNEIRGLLEFRLEENVPLSPRDAFFDYHILAGKDKTEPLRVSVTAYARKTILGYYKACRAADVIPLSLEVEAQAIARASLSKNELGTHMIVDFGKTRTGVGIVHNGSLMYTSTIDLGGNELSEALRRQFGQKSEKEFTNIKNTLGLIRATDDTDVYDALISTMSAIKDEIALRIEYWRTHSGGSNDRDINSIVLCGGSANLKGLPSYFSETLGIESKRAEVWTNAFSLNDHVPPIGKRYSYGYATAIGLALTQFVQS